MKGYAFRRQRAIMNYIADFMCKDLMLVIEVDGFTHWNDEAKKKDEQREKVYNSLDLQFSISQMKKCNNLTVVQGKILQWVEEKGKQKMFSNNCNDCSLFN
jgi:very-short-patch-repair endonuclease